MGGRSRRVRVAIALGSNLGDRRAHIEAAVARLQPDVHAMRVSTLVETAPVGVAPQPDFLNGVLVGETALTAPALLQRLLAIEAELGRTRPFAGAPRPIDLDLILYGDRVIEQPGLTVPHPRFRERPFVLEPLAEIAPEMVDPATGRSVAELVEGARNHPGSSGDS